MNIAFIFTTHASRSAHPPPPHPGGYSHILAIRVCAAGERIVFNPFGLVKCLVIIENWSSIGSRLTGSLTFLVWYKVTKFAKIGLLKGGTFTNPAAHPHPNYMGVLPGRSPLPTPHLQGRVFLLVTNSVNHILSR